MATLYENYTTGVDGANPIATTRYHCQTFTPAIAHTITSVKMLLYRIGSPGTFTVAITAVDGSSKPTGADLATGTYNGNTLTADAGGLWYEITLGAGTLLSASTEYAMQVRVGGVQWTDCVLWRSDDTSPTYAGGIFGSSNDSGSTWTMVTTVDFLFEDWGNPAGQTVSVSEIITLVETSSFQHGFGRAISEVMTLVDSISTRIFPLRVSISEVITLVDIVAKKFSVGRIVSETVTLADTIAKKFRVSVIISEIITLVDSLNIKGRIWTFLSKSATPTWTNKSKSTSPTWTWKQERK